MTKLANTAAAAFATAIVSLALLVGAVGPATAVGQHAPAAATRQAG